MANITNEPPSKRSKTGDVDAGPSSERENPYLAHLNPKSNGVATGSNGNGVGAATGKNPLNGLVPRMVTTEQAKTILVSQSRLFVIRT
jgi:hypothetical protein